MRLLVWTTTLIWLIVLGMGFWLAVIGDPLPMFGGLVAMAGAVLVVVWLHE